jgi:hypothetical protein
VIERVYGTQSDEAGEMELLAILVHKEASLNAASVLFATEPNNLLQVGFFQYKQGHIVREHRHLPKKRPAYQGPTQEVLIIRKGRLAVDFYQCLPSGYNPYVGRKILYEGDVIILLSGGHGFEAFDDTELIEVKDGPYSTVAEDKAYLR